MQNAEWLKIKEIFYQTIDLPKEERKKFLAKQDDSLRLEVLGLLASHEHAENFIVEPAIVEFGLSENKLIGKKISDYKIIKQIGAGGMGTVYLAEKEGLKKKVALKVIKRGMDTEAILRRFVQERQILSRLEHPNIATLFDSGMTDDGLPFFVMEYVEGLPVTKFCEEHQFDLNERLEIFRQICAAVAYSHQNLIVHRDLKPSNILITNDGTPKLLDFGIAKLLNLNGFESTATATQGRMFTPEYASPEQLNGLPITTSTDIYSLGVILYELLSGVRPFQTKSKSYQEVVNLINTQEPLRPSSVVSGEWSVVGKTERNKGITENEDKNPKSSIQNLKSLRGDLDNIILKSIRKESERRYNSVQEFSEDIRRYLVGLPVAATADTTFYHFKKFISRNRFATAIATIVLILSGVSVWQGITANRERAKAEKRFEQVRKLANNVLFEYQDGIKNLAGSTAVREKMVKDSAEYLDNLATENSSNSDLQIELAKAYDRLGDIKSFFSTASVGNALVAREFYQKALQIKEKIQMENAENLDGLEQIAVSYDKLGDVEFGLGNQKTALEYYQKAVGLREQILQKMPDNQSTKFLLMKGYRNIAVRGRNAENTESQMVLCQKALAMSEAFLKESPENIEYLEGYGDVIEGIAAILETSPIRRPEAIEAYQKLIENRRQQSAKFPNNSVLRQKFGMSYSYLGDTFFELNNLPKAIENYRKSLEILEPLGQQDLLNEPLIQDTANIRSSYAYSLAAMGNTSESFDSFNKIIPIFEEKYAKDKTDRTTHFRIAMAKEGLAITYNNFANLPNKTKFDKVNFLKKAIDFYEESLAIYKVYQNQDGAFPSINVDVDQAVTEVSEAVRNCGEKLKEIENKN